MNSSSNHDISQSCTKIKSTQKNKKKYSKQTSQVSSNSSNDHHYTGNYTNLMNQICSQQQHYNSNNPQSETNPNKNTKLSSTLSQTKIIYRKNQDGLLLPIQPFPQSQKYDPLNLQTQVKRKIKQNDCYKPKRESNPFNILKLLYKLLAHHKPIQISSLKYEYLHNVNKISQQKFYKQIHRLQKNRYINYYHKINQQNKIVLSQRGLNFITARTVRKQRLAKQKNILKFNHLKSNSSGIPNDMLEGNQFNIYDKQIIRNIKQASSKLKLVINTLAFTSSQYLLQLQKTLEKDKTLKYQLKQINSNITFFWKADQQIIDCFVLLLQGLQQDLQYLKSALQQQKQYQPTIFILLAQFPNRQQLSNSMKDEYVQKLIQLQYFINQVRTHDINVWRAHDLQDTLIQIKKITLLINKKLEQMIENKQIIYHFGNIDKFNICLSNSKNYNLYHITYKCLKKILYINKNNINKIIYKFYTFYNIYYKLNQLSFKQKFIFLIKLFKDIQIHQNLYQIIIHLLFLDDYSEFKYQNYFKQTNQDDNQGKNQSIFDIDCHEERINVDDDDDQQTRKSNNKKVKRDNNYRTGKQKKASLRKKNNNQQQKKPQKIEQLPSSTNKLIQSSKQTSQSQFYSSSQVYTSSQPYSQSQAYTESQICTSSQAYSYESDEQYITKR